VLRIFVVGHTDGRTLTTRLRVAFRSYFANASHKSCSCKDSPLAEIRLLQIRVTKSVSGQRSDCVFAEDNNLADCTKSSEPAEITVHPPPCSRHSSHKTNDVDKVMKNGSQAQGNSVWLPCATSNWNLREYCQGLREYCQGRFHCTWNKVHSIRG
jgi:hypothetical protein